MEALYVGLGIMFGLIGAGSMVFLILLGASKFYTDETEEEQEIK